MDLTNESYRSVEKITLLNELERTMSVFVRLTSSPRFSGFAFSSSRVGHYRISLDKKIMDPDSLDPIL
jgi:hypothetical protein